MGSVPPERRAQAPSRITGDWRVSLDHNPVNIWDPAGALTTASAERDEGLEAGGEEGGKLVAILRQGAVEIRVHENAIEGRGDEAVCKGGGVIGVRDVLGDDKGFLATLTNPNICIQHQGKGTVTTSPMLLPNSVTNSRTSRYHYISQAVAEVHPLLIFMMYRDLLHNDSKSSTPSLYFVLANSPPQALVAFDVGGLGRNLLAKIKRSDFPSIHPYIPTEFYSRVDKNRTQQQKIRKRLEDACRASFARPSLTISPPPQRRQWYETWLLCFYILNTTPSTEIGYAVDTAGAGGASSSTGLPPPPSLQEEQGAAEQLQRLPLLLPDPLIVQMQVPGAVQATTTVVSEAADVVDDGGHLGSAWTVTLRLSLTTSGNADGALTLQFLEARAGENRWEAWTEASRFKFNAESTSWESGKSVLRVLELYEFLSNCANTGVVSSLTE
ncbi:hypothetical protein BDN71DRAFT_1499217, partial [Pleurotus eryngii]